jgi:hypothetical protein
MASTSVNRPTNTKLKEEDVNRKLQVYGIISAFQAGKVPSNEQIDIALNSFMKSKALASPSKKLSTEGQALVADFRDVVEQAKQLLLSKNEGNLLQDFIWQSQHIDGGNATLPGAPVDKATAQQHGNQAAEGLRTLGTLLISNGQFRKLLSDATILMRDMAGDAAAEATTRVKPNEDQLRQIDEPAGDNTWHDNPDMSAGNIRNQIKSTVNKKAPVDRNDLEAARGNAQQNQDDPQAGARAGVNELRDRASANIPEEDKDKAREKKEKTRAKTKNYISKKMPEERREQTIWRLKKLVVEVQGHPDYQQAINTLLDLAETYGGHANTVGQQSTGTVKEFTSNNKTMLTGIKTLIERFANGTSTDDFFDSLNAIYKDADRDPELKSWFKHLNAYIRKCLKQQGYIMEDQSTQEWNELYDRGNFLLRDRYRNHTDRILDEVKFLADQFDQDPQNKKFANSLEKLFNDLGNDENGKPKFKPHLLKDLSEVILPGIFENVRYVPIPRIEYSDPMIDAVVENLVIESDNLMPNICELANDNYFRWGRKKIANKNHNSATLSVSGIQMDLKDVAYYVKRKQGFPSITDQGVADIYLGGNGFSFKVKMSTAEKSDRQNFFKVDKVDVDVKNFKIKLQKSNHKMLFAIAKPLMLKVIRPGLQKALEKVIKDKVHELDSLCYQIKKEADRAEAEVKDDPEQAPNVYARYVEAAKRQYLQGKKKAEDATADKKVNMAVTKQDSIFPNIHLPGGISSKATEYKELAKKGDKWESPIFKLGSASTSTNIPAATNVTRKDHSVNSGGVRGPQNVGNTSSATGTNGSANLGTNGSVNLGTNGSANLGTNGSANTYTNGSANTAGGFSNQVDQAFSKDVPLGTNGNTTLGANNPVLTGRN